MERVSLSSVYKKIQMVESSELSIKVQDRNVFHSFVEQWTYAVDLNTVTILSCLFHQCRCCSVYNQTVEYSYFDKSLRLLPNEAFQSNCPVNMNKVKSFNEKVYCLLPIFTI